jgi:hypothetical protein
LRDGLATGILSMGVHDVVEMVEVVNVVNLVDDLTMI